MTQPTAGEEIEQAERHVAQFQRIVARQQAIVAELREHGHPTQAAERLLDTMRRSLALVSSDLDQKRRPDRQRDATTRGG